MALVPLMKSRLMAPPTEFELPQPFIAFLSLVWDVLYCGSSRPVSSPHEDSRSVHWLSLLLFLFRTAEAQTGKIIRAEE